MKRLTDWIVAAVVLLLGRRRRRAHLGREAPDRVVAAGPRRPGSELLAIAALGAASLCAVGFVVVYAVDSLPAHTQLLGLSIGLCFAFVAAAFLILAHRVVPEEELEGKYPETTPEEQLAVERIVDESGDSFTRKRLLKAAAGGAAGTIGLALITPALSLGPFLHTAPFYRTPWRRGRRLVDERGRPYRARDIEEKTFYTAFPEDADREVLGAPLVVVRLAPEELALPDGRGGWAPGGILAYSKICTHAGCAVSLYRVPTFAPVEPKPALVCPCHYSTFDPATGGTVTFGPAGRPLPQLPLLVDDRGYLRAGGNFSGPVGPSWWGVRNRRARS
jgi:ubiquinol-cytochrome c reductase iron-sulfur subunit